MVEVEVKLNDDEGLYCYGGLVLTFAVYKLSRVTKTLLCNHAYRSICMCIDWQNEFINLSNGGGYIVQYHCGIPPTRRRRRRRRRRCRIQRLFIVQQHKFAAKFPVLMQFFEPFPFEYSTTLNNVQRRIHTNLHTH